MALVEEKPNNIVTPTAWYSIAVSTAVVAAVFSFIVCVLIVVNYGRGRIMEPRWEQELANLKIELRSRPNDEQLLSQIRQLDLQTRRHRLRKLDFSRRGSYLLFGYAVVFVVAAKLAVGIRKRLPVPQPHTDERRRQVLEAMRARWAVTAALAVLAAGALFLGLGPSIDFAEAAGLSVSYPSQEQIGENWPRFRGPNGSGISPYANIPTSWDGKSNKGILWRAEVPLPGHNSPVVWGDRVFLSGADPNGRAVYCFDVHTGRLLWSGNVPTSSQESDELDAGYAASTVATDGRRVCAIFATGDVGCFDFDGKKLWTRSLGMPDNAYGCASSLEIYRNLLLIQYDQGVVEDEKSKLIALNTFSGQTVWEAKRPVPNSWSSPIVAKIGSSYQVITCGDPWLIAYNPDDGAELWRAKCLGGEVAPSAIYAGGLVFAAEPYTSLVAIKPDGRGDVTGTHVLWRADEGIPDISCPVSDGKLVFVLTTEGLLTCYTVSDGSKVYEKDFAENFMASPSLAAGRLYLLSEKGVTYVVAAGPQYEELARCELGERCYASPAFSDGRMYIRGSSNLYCIAHESP
jgi:outer membrane protein assembly factor BamB